MTPRGMSIGAGLLVAVLSAIWLGSLVKSPTLTYDVEDGEVVRLRC